MFTGIIEETGIVRAIISEGTNYHIRLQSPLATNLKIDQSLSHNGACLTVVNLPQPDEYVVTAIEETLRLTNIKYWQLGDGINLERSLPANGRLDGHIVQGHVDLCATCTEKTNLKGSWHFEFDYKSEDTEQMVIEKGSISINGVSLTVVGARTNGFGVNVIPYTYEHTNFSTLSVGDQVNIEFDLIGKYLAGYMRRLQINI